jgi:hypothetical protein
MITMVGRRVMRCLLVLVGVVVAALSHSDVARADILIERPQQQPQQPSDTTKPASSDIPESVPGVPKRRSCASEPSSSPDAWRFGANAVVSLALGLVALRARRRLAPRQ